MAYQNYAGAWLTQSNDNYDWLPNPWTPVSLSPGVDTVKIWQNYVLPDNAPNLIVFGDGQYAAGNSQDNVIVADAAHNLLYGGAGDDVFVGSGGSGTTFIVAQGEGDKVIQNFTEGADTLRLIGGPLTSFAAVQQAMRQQGADVALNDGAANILFRNASVGQFQAKDFQLPLAASSLGAQTFSENFDNPATIGTNWQTNFGYAGDGLNSFTLTHNAEQEIYTSPDFHGTGAAPLGLNPFSFNNGVMTISATPVTDAQSQQMWGYRYSSGMLESNFSQTYGYFEMRAELPHGQGLWPAFWLLGDQNKEIDVLEGLGSDTKTAYNAVHSPDVPSLGNASFNPYGDGFHTYGVLWTPQTLTYYVDGSPVWQTPTPADMNSPMHMIVNLAVGGNWPGSPDATTPFPANMQIDYVHAYALGDPNAPQGGAPLGGGAAPAAPASPQTPPPAPTPAPAPSDGSGQVLTSATDFPGSVLAAGAGDDTINAGRGSDTMTGGAGADHFVFAQAPWAPAEITDFVHGQDVIDLKGVLAGSGYGGSDPVADHVITLLPDGADGTKVLVGSNYFLHVDHVAPGAFTGADWITH